MSGQDKTNPQIPTNASALTSSTTNTLTSAFNSTTSALTSTISSLSSVLPLPTTTPFTAQQNTQQPQQESPSSSTRTRRTIVATHPPETGKQTSSSDGGGSKPPRNVNKLTEEMFGKVGEYLKGEILGIYLLFIEFWSSIIMY